MDNMCGPCSNERVSEVDVYNQGDNFFLGTHAWTPYHWTLAELLENCLRNYNCVPIWLCKDVLIRNHFIVYREFIKFGRHDHDSNTPSPFSPGRGSRQPLHRPARCSPWGQRQSLWPLSPEGLRGEMEERKTLLHGLAAGYIATHKHSLIPRSPLSVSYCKQWKGRGLGTRGYVGTLLSGHTVHWKHVLNR